MASENKIHTYPEVRVTCLGCEKDMPYRTVDEEAAGRTIQMPLRFCASCHTGFVRDMEMEREGRDARRAADVHTNAFATIFSALRRTEGR